MKYMLYECLPKWYIHCLELAYILIVWSIKSIKSEHNFCYYKVVFVCFHNIEKDMKVFFGSILTVRKMSSFIHFIKILIEGIFC